MPINPALALQVKGLELPDPLAQMAQVTQIQGAMQQQKIAGMQIEQLEQDRREMLELQQKLSQMGQNPDLRVVAQTLMRSPKTLQLGTQMLEKLKEQEGYAALLKRGEPTAAAAPGAAAAPAMPGAAPAAAGMAPAGARTNALAPQGAEAPEPVNALLGRGLRSPEEIRREMLELAQFQNIPQAKARVEILKTELAEALKAPTLHNVPGRGAVDPRTGRVVVSEVQRPTATQQDYDRAVQQGFKGTFLDYKKALAEAGRATTTVTTNVSSGEKLTPLQEAIDKKFADDLISWKSGSSVSAAKNAAQIANVLDQLHEGKQLTGPMIGITPDVVLAVTNPAALDARQRVEQVAQESLRTILGAQFTQKEGDAFIARVYDPKLSPQKNASRLRALFKQIDEASKQKQAMVDYADTHGTLRGFKGTVPTMADFYAAIGEKPEDAAKSARPRASAPVRPSDGATSTSRFRLIGPPSADQ